VSVHRANMYAFCGKPDLAVAIDELRFVWLNEFTLHLARDVKSRLRDDPFR
jgi:hypothetical protein